MLNVSESKFLTHKNKWRPISGPKPCYLGLNAFLMLNDQKSTEAEISYLKSDNENLTKIRQANILTKIILILMSVCHSSPGFIANSD